MDKTESERTIEAMPAIPALGPTNVTPQMLWDQLTSAFEGGSNYWIGSVEIVAPATVCKRTYIQDIPFLGGTLRVVLAEPDDVSEVKLLTLDSMIEGAKALAAKYPHHWADLIGECGDAITGDVLLQMSILGDLVYG
jgi:hypothetical protein